MLIRLALIPPCTIPVIVISMASGMTAAVISAARRLPSRRSSTATTRVAPSRRLRPTVSIVASTSRVLSSTVWTSTPRGSEAEMRLSSASTPEATVRLLPPTSIRAVPITASSPSLLADPVRRSCPMATSAMSEIRTGTPAFVLTTTSRMSSMDSRRPAARTT